MLRLHSIWGILLSSAIWFKSMSLLGWVGWDKCCLGSSCTSVAYHGSVFYLEISVSLAHNDVFYKFMYSSLSSEVYPNYGSIGLLLWYLFRCFVLFWYVAFYKSIPKYILARRSPVAIFYIVRGAYPDILRSKNLYPPAVSSTIWGVLLPRIVV